MSSGPVQRSGDFQALQHHLHLVPHLFVLFRPELLQGTAKPFEFIHSYLNQLNATKTHVQQIRRNLQEGGHGIASELRLRRDDLRLMCRHQPDGERWERNKERVALALRRTDWPMHRVLTEIESQD